MGQCLGCKKKQDNVLKQDKNIDDKRMFKLGIDVLNRDFCIQIGYNRKAVKTYGQCVSPRQNEVRTKSSGQSPLSFANEYQKGDPKAEGCSQPAPPENIASARGNEVS